MKFKKNKENRDTIGVSLGKDIVDKLNELNDALSRGQIRRCIFGCKLSGI